MGKNIVYTTINIEEADENNYIYYVQYNKQFFDIVVPKKLDISIKSYLLTAVKEKINEAKEAKNALENDEGKGRQR